MTILKAEVVGGIAYILDEWGNIWQLNAGQISNLPELHLVTILSHEARNSIMEPQLARFALQ